MAVTTSVLDRLRQLRRELRQYAGEQSEHVWLQETQQHIPLINAMAPQNYREIGELLRAGTSIGPGEAEYAKVVRRGLDKRAPFASGKNSVADALLIEIYATQITAAASSDVHAFVTCNHREFSAPNGDRRQPHPGLADLFDGARSRYAYQIEGLHDLLVDRCGDEYLEEHDEAGFLIGEGEPRTLAEILDAEQEFFDRVWYVRSIVHSDQDTPGLFDDLRARMMAARQRIEDKYGRDNLWNPIGPGHNEAWKYGYINGKLSALRWVRGSE